MSTFESKWERVEEDDPRRCQHIGSQGQCRIKAVDGSSYCPAHGGNKAYQAAEKRELRNYRLNKFKERLGELGNSNEILSLKDEISILRMLVEEKMNACSDNTDLILMAGPLSDLMMKIERVVTSCQRLDSRLGNLLDKGRVIHLAQAMVQIISDEIDDPEILEKISNKILKLLQNEGNPKNG